MNILATIKEEIKVISAVVFIIIVTIEIVARSVHFISRFRT